MATRSAALPIERHYLAKAKLFVGALVLAAVVAITLAFAMTGSPPAGGTSLDPVPDQGSVEVQHEPVVVNGTCADSAGEVTPLSERDGGRPSGPAASISQSGRSPTRACPAFTRSTETCPTSPRDVCSRAPTRGGAHAYGDREAARAGDRNEGSGDEHRSRNTQAEDPHHASGLDRCAGRARRRRHARRDRGELGRRAGPPATAATQVGRPLVNTPTELSGGIAGFEYAGISVNTPSELRGGVIGASTDADFTAVAHVPKRTDMTAVPNGTPSELSGGRVGPLPTPVHVNP